MKTVKELLLEMKNSRIDKVSFTCSKTNLTGDTYLINDILEKANDDLLKEEVINYKELKLIKILHITLGIKNI